MARFSRMGDSYLNVVAGEPTCVAPGQGGRRHVWSQVVEGCGKEQRWWAVRHVLWEPWYSRMAAASAGSVFKPFSAFYSSCGLK